MVALASHGMNDCTFYNNKNDVEQAIDFLPVSG
jgi:hypothetical protein